MLTKAQSRHRTYFFYYVLFPMGCYKGCPHLGIVVGGKDLISVLLYRFQFKTKEFLPTLHSYLSPGLEDWESEGSEDSRYST